MAKLTDSARTDLDETRRLLYMMLVVNRTKRFNLVGTVANAMLHHQHFTDLSRDGLLDLLVDQAEGSNYADWFTQQIDRLTAEIEASDALADDADEDEDKIGQAMRALFVEGKRLILWHAETYARAQLAFREAMASIEGQPDLKARVKRFRHANGEQEVELADGARLLFRAGNLARGYSPDLVITD